MSTPLPNILIVDDTVENLRLLSALLAECGYEPRPVRSGTEAIAAAQHFVPDLILLDVMMPELDGFETCARLKAIPPLREVPVIFLTALDDQADKLRAFAAGGADYITKPFRAEEVLARVRVHLELRSAHVELADSLERLRTLEQLRDDLVHMVVHDMRGPLTVLLAHLGFLKEESAAGFPPDAAADIDAALHAANVLNGMTSDLLDISRLDAGKLPLHLAWTDLGELAAQVRADVAAVYPKRVIELDAPKRAEVECDTGIVRRVLENLLGNAIKYTPATGRIRLVVTAGDPARVEVLDEGPGIPVEARERIFEKFGTLEERRAVGHRSSGLWLAFCKLAVEAHGGRIGVRDADGGGAAFWFELPQRDGTTP